MALAESYPSGSYAGVAEFLFRTHSANIHGIETALTASTTDHVDQATGINVPAAVLQEAPLLAFTLMAVPMALDNAFRAVASRLGWPEAGKA